MQKRMGICTVIAVLLLFSFNLFSDEIVADNISASEDIVSEIKKMLAEKIDDVKNQSDYVETITRLKKEKLELESKNLRLTDEKARNLKLLESYYTENQKKVDDLSNKVEKLSEVNTELENQLKAVIQDKNKYKNEYDIIAKQRDDLLALVYKGKTDSVMSQNDIRYMMDLEKQNKILEEELRSLLALLHGGTQTEKPKVETAPLVDKVEIDLMKINEDSIVEFCTDLMRQINNFSYEKPRDLSLYEQNLALSLQDKLKEEYQNISAVVNKLKISQKYIPADNFVKRVGEDEFIVDTKGELITEFVDNSSSGKSYKYHATIKLKSQRVGNGFKFLVIDIDQKTL